MKNLLFFYFNMIFAKLDILIDYYEKEYNKNPLEHLNFNRKLYTKLK